MTDNNKSSKTPNAWIAIDHNFSRAQVLTYYTLQLKGEHSLHQAISDNDWILVLDTTGNISRVGRILRIRSDLETTTIFFDRMLQVKSVVSIGITPFKFPPKDRAGRIQWTDFIETLPKEFHITIADIPKIEDQTYIRELLQLAVMDDLLGPAGGPNELIVDMGVRDRYLVGKLAPREAAERGQEFPVDAEDIEDEEPDLIVKAKTAKVNSPSVLGSGETDTAEEIDAASNQSLVPSSLGMTFCVDGDVDRVEIEARWGRYERVPNDEHQFFKSNGQKAKVWKRIPCGGKIVLPLIEGSISHNAPDSTSPEVRVQGSIRAKNDNGDRLITLFLVNAQEEPDTNRDTAWVFQPELIVRAEKDAAKPAIFRRRPVLDADGMDPEREALEMIYRDRVEFAVGHGVAVHAEIADDVTLAT